MGIKVVVLSFSLMTLSSVVILYGVAKALYTFWWKTKSLERKLRSQGIRGTPYRLGLGDLKKFVKQTTGAWDKPMNLNHQIVPHVDPFTFNVTEKYGKLSFCWFGTRPRLIIKDPVLMTEVLSNKQGHFQKPPLSPLILILSRGLTTLEGEEWAKRRRLLNPAFHLEKLKVMFPVFSACCQQMIQQWKQMTALKNTCEIDVWPELQKLTADVISHAAFGSNYKQGKQIFKHQRELMELVVEAMKSSYIPGFRFLPTKKNQKRNKLYGEITSMIQNIISQKEHAMKSGESREDDLLGILIRHRNQSNILDHANNKGDWITDEEVTEECKQFYLAGQETTSSLLTWTIIILAMHLDWQEKAREEVLRACEKKAPDFESLNKLKFVTMILFEVLRLYPPAIAIYQHTYQKTKIGEISIPAGIDIVLPILLIHHDAEYWGDDHEEFKPERFAEGISRASSNHLAFFPFGWGPRTCIGQNFAILEAKLALAIILQHFSIRLSPSYCHAPYTTMMLQPQHGAPVILQQI